MLKAITTKYDPSGRRVLDIGVLGSRPRISAGDAISKRIDRQGRRILDVGWKSPLILPSIASIQAQSPTRQPLTEIPVISRGLPFSASTNGGFAGTVAEINAIDNDYGTTWNSITAPSTGSPAWFVLDLRSIPANEKTNLWMVWKQAQGIFYDGTSTLGSTANSPWNALPRNYSIQGHASSGAQPAVGDAGWVTVASVVDNRFGSKIHSGLDFSGYNWFRFYCTASNGVTGTTDSVVLQFDLRNASDGTEDSIFVYGDSIFWEGFSGQRPGNIAWDVGPIENMVESQLGRTAPVLIDGSTGGWMASDGDTNKTTLISPYPCKYVVLGFGDNDAHNAGIDLNSLGGVNSDYAQTFKSHYQSLVDYCSGLGKKVIIPIIIARDNTIDGFGNNNIQILNQILDQVKSENASVVLDGPDLYTFFSQHISLLRDGIHPTYDPGSQATLNGLSGYAYYHQIWYDWLVANLY